MAKKAGTTVDTITVEHWRAPSGALWQVLVHWVTVDGRVEPLRITLETAHDQAHPISAWEPGTTVTPLLPDVTPITATDLRALPLATILRQSREGASTTARTISERADDPNVRGHHAQRAKSFDRRKGKKITDEELQEVARVYREAWARREDPTNAVADELDMSRSTAGKRVIAARLAGHLPPATRGKITV